VAHLQGRVRRGLVGSLAAAAIVGATLITTAVVDPAGAVTSYDDYIVFGEHGVVVGNGSTVTGMVGARQNHVSPNIEAIKVQGLADIIGDARSGADINMQGNTSITGTATFCAPPTGPPTNQVCGALTKQATSVVGTINQVATIGAVDLPVGGIPTQWPGGAAAHCGTQGAPTNHAPDHIFAGNNNSLTITAGTYGTLDLNSGSTLSFSGPGDFFIDEIIMANSSHLSFAAGQRIFVCAKFGIGQLSADAD